MIDPRYAFPFLIAILPPAVFGGIFIGAVEAQHHNWVMGILAALSTGLFVTVMPVQLVMFDPVLTERPRRLIWIVLVLATGAMYLAGTVMLENAAWPVQWGLPLVCLLPLYLTRAAVRAARTRQES
ncbi:hypothetical protein [Actinocorallia populi]|uniref:hypothetical protein n=1 Tax=Actinocorallia populi TaxID=2079200 RepID=UPI000D091BBF|nr:hypothetical protein [Actinocorallia populi]